MADAKKVTITVKYLPGQTPNYSFSSTLPTGNGGELIFKNDNFPGFELSYTLDPESFGNLVFPNDPNLALASAVIENGVNKCPQSGTIWDGFKPVPNKSTNQTLVVRNPNGKLPPGKDQELFGYTLFVTADPNGDPADFIALDPIGSNQNGSSRQAINSWAIIAVVIVAVGAAVYFALS